MRLLSLTVRHYRIHLDRRIEFDPERTLIGGPNESGKSTLMEAAHRALFLSHRRGGQDLESMRSRHSSEPPEVQLVFEQMGSRYTLTKRFSGTRGSHAELTDEAHSQWTGQDAEEKLAELLGLDEPVAPNRADAQWAHLWIRQGASGNDPSEQATAERDALLDRLQSQGGAAVMQSELDARVAARFTEACGKWFTQNGSPRAGSPLKEAEDALEEAQRLLDEREQVALRLEDAIRTHDTASRQATEAEAQIPKLRELAAATEAQLKEAERLRTETTAAEKALLDAKSHHRELSRLDAEIRELAGRLNAETRRAEPLRQKLSDTLTAKSHAEKQLTERRRQTGEAAESVTRLRRRVDWLRSLVDQRRVENELKQLSGLTNMVATLRKALEKPTRLLAELPGITEADLKTLRRLDGRRREAAAALEAMATGIEWIEGPGPITLGGETLEPGVPRIVTEAEELVISGHRLRIHPGGGNRLEQARTDLENAEREFAAALARPGVADLDEAVRCFEQRRTAEAERKQLRAKLDELDPEGVAAKLEQAEDSRRQLAAQAKRLQPDDDSAPEDPQAALAEATEQLEDASRNEATTRSLVAREEDAADKASAAWEQARQALEAQQQELRDLTQRHQFLLETHGDDEARRDKLATAKREEETLTATAKEAHQRLAQLQPELLAADLQRHQRALSRQQEALQQAALAKAGAEATLRSDGASDPHAALREATEAVERATRDHRTEQRRAEAIKRLAELFGEEQQRLSDQFTEPLVEKVGDYLRCVFGPEATARLSLDAGAFQGLELVRPGGPFDFPALSGGTREQLAAAVRLAMAELLAENHGGCLPVVFDDAFTHSDPTRVMALQRMLDLAATRGLQVIVLTCTPADYSSLGARSVLLDPRPLPV